jgi:hypothetical protein
VIPFTIAITRSKFQEPVLLAAGSKALVCGRSLSGIADSNPAEGVDALMHVVCCRVKVSATGRSALQRSPPRCECMCVCHLV